MSLPPELRVLCAQLSSTSTTELPRITPTLLRHVAQCHVPLSSQAANAAKPDSTGASVYVHKLKTQLSSLLNGKSPEGRFTAVVLIKAVVEVGGWEILKGSEPWVRGLLSILGKPDSTATKELCIIALTKIYRLTHQYQTLLREITTPTLPSFITSCLNLLTSKSSNPPSTTVEVIFQSFIALIPRHTTIYRPYTTQIKLAVRQYLAPTTCDSVLVPKTLQQSAQHLAVMLHQTVAKGGGGEEWGKSFRQMLKSVHVTADTVFRGVIEDWESTEGYIGESSDVNVEAAGGARSADDLSSWTGVSAGAERITGLLDTMSTYIRAETSTPVTIPLGAVTDLLVRVLSISVPATSFNKVKEGPRLNPAVDKDEKDILWSSMPQIYVAALSLVEAMADRLQGIFLPLAQGILAQIAWVFSYGRTNPDFRRAIYQVTAKLLKLSGQSLTKPQTAKLSVIIRTCCKDLQGPQGTGDGTSTSERSTQDAQGQIVDSFLPQASTAFQFIELADVALTEAAKKLLPIFVSSIPQQFLDIAIRSTIERTAILTHNKEAMLECVLHPFLGKNGTPLASIVPHLTRAFGSDSTVEILLRPRMPLLPSSGVRYVNHTLEDISEDEDMEFRPEGMSKTDESQGLENGQGPMSTTPSIFRTGETSALVDSVVQPTSSASNLGERVVPAESPARQGAPVVPSSVFMATSAPNLQTTAATQDTEMNEASDDSSDAESVHLTMQLDSESDSDDE